MSADVSDSAGVLTVYSMSVPPSEQGELGALRSLFYSSTQEKLAHSIHACPKVPRAVVPVIRSHAQLTNHFRQAWELGARHTFYHQPHCTSQEDITFSIVPCFALSTGPSMPLAMLPRDPDALKLLLTSSWCPLLAISMPL